MLTLLALYGGLFLTALVAATLLPAQSELLLGTLLVQSGEPAWALITVATLGNSAGSAVNWWLGRYLTRFQDRRWFPFSPESLRNDNGGVLIKTDVGTVVAAHAMLAAHDDSLDDVALLNGAAGVPSTGWP